jgi:hypothetical protein
MSPLRRYSFTFYMTSSHTKLTRPKEAIKELTMERFDIINAKRNAEANASTTNGSEPVVNGHMSDTPVKSIERPSTPPASPSPSSPIKKRFVDGDGLPDGVTSPPKKKRKPEADADAVLAARLQAEENLRARPTRGGNARKVAPIKKKKTPTKVKTSKKIRAEDDSDIGESGEEDKEEKKVNRNTGFHVSQSCVIMAFSNNFRNLWSFLLHYLNFSEDTLL